MHVVVEVLVDELLVDVVLVDEVVDVVPVDVVLVAVEVVTPPVPGAPPSPPWLSAHPAIIHVKKANRSKVFIDTNLLSESGLPDAYRAFNGGEKVAVPLSPARSRSGPERCGELEGEGEPAAPHSFLMRRKSTSLLTLPSGWHSGQ
jgi:hypothetical protein